MQQTFRFKGIDLAPSGRHTVEPSRNIHRIRYVTDTTGLEGITEEPLATQASILISDSGDETAILPSATGPYIVDWISGSEIDPLNDDLTAGGFLPVEKISKLSEQAKQKVASSQDKQEFREALIRLFRELGLVDDSGRPSRRVPSGTRNNAGQTAGQEPPKPQQGGAEGGQEKAKVDKPSFLDGLPEAAQSTAANIIANALSNAELGKTIFRAKDLMGSLAGGLASMGQAYLVGQILGGMKPDAESSTLDWAKFVLGPKLAKSVLFGPLSDMTSRLFFNIPGPYEGNALRVTDFDDAWNSITAGFPSVLIEGQPAARGCDEKGPGDPLDEKGMPIGEKCLWGADKVFIGEKPAARLNNLVNPGYGTHSYPATIPFTLCGAAKRTYIGGVTSCPNPPPPPDFSGESGYDPSKPNREANPHDEPPKEAGMYWDPEVKEWRMWDPAFGWSSTLSESYANNALFGELLGKPNWKQNEDGSLLVDNMWWKLGTTEWPGAGQGNSWWIPDLILPGIFKGDSAIDMKQALSNLHDWLFHPHNTGDHSLWSHLVNTEWKAFIQGWSKINPLQWLFKIGYSAATTIKSLIIYLDSYLNAIDEGPVTHTHSNGPRK